MLGLWRLYVRYMLGPGCPLPHLRGEGCHQDVMVSLCPTSFEGHPSYSLAVHKANCNMSGSTLCATTLCHFASQHPTKIGVENAGQYMIIQGPIAVMFQTGSEWRTHRSAACKLMQARATSATAAIWCSGTSCSVQSNRNCAATSLHSSNAKIRLVLSLSRLWHFACL